MIEPYTQFSIVLDDDSYIAGETLTHIMLASFFEKALELEGMDDEFSECEEDWEPCDNVHWKMGNLS